MNLRFDDKLEYDDFSRLRDEVRWDHLSERQFNVLYSKALYTVVCHDGDRTVSMAFVVGDGAYHFQITQVIVEEAYQGLGIGKQMIERIMQYIDSVIEEGEVVMVTLMAAKNKEGFYKKFGFVERPNEERGAGMSLFYRK